MARKQPKMSMSQIVRARAEAGMGPVVMKRVLRSSNVAAVGYDKTTRTMYVEFLKGYRPRVGRLQKKKLKPSETVIYKYFMVPPNVPRQMLASPSKGKYHWRHVRGRYRYALLGRKGWRGPQGGHRARAHKPASFSRK